MSRFAPQWRIVLRASALQSLEIGSGLAIQHVLELIFFAETGDAVGTEVTLRPPHRSGKVPFRKNGSARPGKTARFYGVRITVDCICTLPEGDADNKTR